ncbi:hypothetical protein SAMN05216233_10414 [Desulfoluna spongiiphila]|uniref:DUF6160 domain-containing protein n=1 Tax=Desulfoluna spongiiphila TaxID=419481 RepID=A0A1G5D6C4_9BACT|nr:hypothetical protein SAMN05216233_10414 [Desulfoluna spongiiphila]
MRKPLGPIGTLLCRCLSYLAGSPARTGIRGLSLLVALLALPCVASGMEALSEHQMKGTTAQAGISIAMDDVTFYHHVDAFRLTDPDDPSGYMEFQDIESLTTIDVGTSDVNGDNTIGCITLDLFTVSDATSPINGKPLLYLVGADIDYNKDLTIGAINVCGTDIGSAAVDNYAMPSFHLYLGAHDCGVDLEFGARITMDQFSYGTSPDDTLTLSGITLAGSFTDNPADTPSDPSTWQAGGEFVLGDIASGNPLTIDVATDTTASWADDADGNPIPNPRLGSGFIAINMPMEGSLRIENMGFGTNDFGALALDNIQAHKLYIEIPGRGLGVP